MAREHGASISQIDTHQLRAYHQTNNRRGARLFALLRVSGLIQQIRGCECLEYGISQGLFEIARLHQRQLRGALGCDERLDELLVKVLLQEERARVAPVTIEHGEVADCDLWVKAQILDDLPTVFHRVALANLRHNSRVVTLHLEVHLTDHEMITGHNFSLFL